MYKIILHKKVIKFINSRNPKEKQKIKEKFELLQNNPYPVNFQIDSKKLQNRDGFRLRIGNYRFIYDVVENELIIYMEDADNRGRYLLGICRLNLKNRPKATTVALGTF